MAKSRLFLVLLPLALLPTSAGAQTIGYADAVGRMSNACRADIAKHCKTTQLGGGQMQQCLNKPGISIGCKSTVTALTVLIRNRAAARAAVPKVCDADIRRFCQGMQLGDGNLMGCFDQVKENISTKCRQTVIDAGYDVGLAPNQPTDQVALDSNRIVQNLNRGTAQIIDVPRLRQIVSAGLNDPSRVNAVNRAPIVEQLNSLAQITIAIEFDLNSARIKPESFRAVGLMADSLNSPYLQNSNFLIVGNTDATGSREHNLKLSQERADAVRAALINPFEIKPARLETIGMGEEQLLNSAKPDAAENRRVQLINIGR
jgi:outer membrane protein OmpA-like peptidoglycan-associated protein